MALPAVHRRVRVATSIQIDRERFCHALYRRRLTLRSAGMLIDRSESWASVISFKGHASLYALDELACALGLHVGELIEEIATDAERERISIA